MAKKKAKNKFDDDIVSNQIIGKYGDIVEKGSKVLADLKNFKTIGIRNGEKMHETLLTREEKFKSEDLGDYFRIKSDTRGLNYEQYFSEGSADISQDEFTSNSTELLNKDQLIDLLMTLQEVQSELS